MDFSFRRLSILPLDPERYYGKKHECRVLLTGKLRKLLELVLPNRIHINDLGLLSFSLYPKPDLFASLEQLVCVSRVKSIEDREEVFTTAFSTLGVSVWKVIGHVAHLEAGVIKLGDGYLVIVWRVAHPGILHLEQLLFSFEDLLQVIGGHHLVARHVVLSRLVKVIRNLRLLTTAPSCNCKRMIYLRKRQQSLEVEPFEVSSLSRRTDFG